MSDPADLERVTAGERLVSSRALHAVVPESLISASAGVYGNHLWRKNEEKRESALNWARSLGRLQEPAEDLARRALRHWAAREALFWRSRGGKRIPVTGWEHVEAAQERGPGVVLATSHVGALSSLFYALPARGVPLHVPRRPAEAEAQLQEGYAGQARRFLRSEFERLGGTWVPIGGSFSAFADSLAAGATCLLTIDTRGDAEVTAMDQQLAAPRGIAELAIECDAPILPCIGVIRHGRRIIIAREPLDPRDFPESAELLQAVADELYPLIEANLDQLYPRALPTLDRQRAYERKDERRRQKEARRIEKEERRRLKEERRAKAAGSS